MITVPPSVIAALSTAAIGLGIGGAAAWQWRSGEVERLRHQRTDLVAKVTARDAAITRLERGNKDLTAAVKEQGESLAQIAQQAADRQQTAADALAAVRRSQESIRTAIARLDGKIGAPAAAALDCPAAVAEIRSELAP